jgi:hypothetical protein
MVVDDGLSEEWRKRIEDAGVRLLIATEEKHAPTNGDS